MRESGNQRLIITHAVLTGLTPLIPIPILDDLARSYFQRRLVRQLAESYRRALSEQDVRVLADDANGGCFGCVGGAFLLPFKLIFRKLFFFLEWKRAADTVSRTYHQGYLLEYALREGGFPDQHATADVRAAIDAVLREVGTGPVERAVRLTFSQSKSALSSAARLLRRSLQGLSRKPDEEQVAQAAKAVEEERVIEGVTRGVQCAASPFI
ncbi:MAG TPA: hypothetical protein VNS63_17980 [Blastocatellia bacterium]|nr:hypothetical protein [Blastocatellia bacterium]